MYDFHYNYIKKKYGACADLCFTHADSLCYDISTKDVYVDSNTLNLVITQIHYFHSEENKKVLGLLKTNVTVMS